MGAIMVLSKNISESNSAMNLIEVLIWFTFGLFSFEDFNFLPPSDILFLL